MNEIKIQSPVKVLKSKPAPAAEDLKEGQIAIGNVGGKPTLHGKIGEEIIDLTRKTKADVGLGNVTDDAQVKRSEMGKADGVATLDRSGKVPSAQLPSYVDDVVDIVTVMDAIPSRAGNAGEMIGVIGTNKGLYSFKSGSAWEKSGDWETGKIYLTKEASAQLEDGSKYGANAVLRWSGTALAQVSNPLAIGKVKGTAFDGGDGKALEDWKEKIKLLYVYSNGYVTQSEQSVDIEFEAYPLDNPQNMRDEAFSIPAASPTKAGVMTAEDKKALGNIQYAPFHAAYYMPGSVVQTTHTAEAVDLSVSLLDLRDKNLTQHKQATPIKAATRSSAGVMTAADKTKLDSIPEGAAIVTGVVLETVTI